MVDGNTDCVAGFRSNSAGSSALVRSTVVALILVLSGSPCLWAGLIAKWSANGTTAEAVAGRDGTLIGGATFGTGIAGQAFHLDGANDFVSVADDNVWSFANDPFTVALWVNFDTIRQAPLGQLPNVFIGHDQGGGQQNKWVFFHDGDDNLAFHINDPSPTLDFLTAPVSFSPVADRWYHLAVTRSGSTYSFYADGTSLGSATTTRTIGNASGPLTIGQAEGLGHLDGRLDEIQIFNEALSLAEIQLLASIPEPGALVLLLPLGFGLVARRRKRTC